MIYKTDEQIKEDIVSSVDRLIDKNARLLKANQELFRKLKEPNDERLAAALEKISELEEKVKTIRANSLYILSEEEKERKSKIWKEHRETGCRRPYVIEVCGTGIGSVVTYVCNCGYRETIGDDF